MMQFVIGRREVPARFGRSFGVMQGRLSRQTERGYQAFPWEDWRLEFDRASALDLQHIEWVLDSRDWEENPLIVAPESVTGAVQESGVQVISVCADYLMDTPLSPRDERSWSRLEQVLTSMSEVGATDLVIPFVDQSSFVSTSAGENFLSSSDRLAELARGAGIRIALETDLAPLDFKRILAALDPETYWVNYDIGNSSSLGFDPEEEMAAYAYRVSVLHIKDRVRHGASVPLGQGDADIAAVVRLLHAAGFSGITTMQAFRDIEGLEVFDRQLRFVGDVLCDLEDMPSPS